jgi:uncharacterized protein (TIGR02453 family)
MKTVLKFLEELNKNNNREWFDQHRDWYTESRDKILFITEVLINEIRRFDPGLAVTNPKDCVFRIFRDVRFSNDKRPYKTNFGSFIASGGRKSTRAGYYFHIEPGSGFVGGGMYMPPADILKALRTHVANHPLEFLEIIQDKQFTEIYPELYDHKLKTAPKGFDKNFEFIELLKYQSYVFSRNLPDHLITGENFIPELVRSFQILYPLNDFLNKVL